MSDRIRFEQEFAKLLGLETETVLDLGNVAPPEDPDAPE